MPILTAEERLGTKLADKYRLDRLLGRGGFGVVYAGVHEWTGRPVATKVLNHELGQQQSFVKRFLQEARAAAKLNHPNVVDVLDMGQEPDGTVYLVLELLAGEDLSAVLKRRGILPLQEALEILLPVMDALADAHRHGIVHRDLKPDNIFLSRDVKGRSIPKLLDFGIAKVADSGGTATSTGMVIGTPHYMAPEQARGLSDVGPQADVWSMAVVLWQCLSGTVPFDAGTPTGVLAEILTRRAPSFAQVVPSLAGPLAQVIDRALQHERERRFADMAAFVDAIQAVNAGGGDVADAACASAPLSLPTSTPAVAGAARAQPTPHAWSSRAEPSSGSGGRLWVAAAMVAPVLVAGVVIGGIALWPSNDPAPTQVSGGGSLPPAAPVTASRAPSPMPPISAEPASTVPAMERPVLPAAPDAGVADEPTPANPVATGEPTSPSPAASASEPRTAPATRQSPPARPAPLQPRVRTLGAASDPTHPPRSTTGVRIGTNSAPILR